MNMSKIMKLMKNAKNVKKQTKKLTNQLKKKQFTGQAPNKLVTLTMTGDKKLINIHFAQKVLDAKDGDTLSDLLISTINKTENKIDKYNSKAVKNQFKGLM